jgi:hypothetical protein
VIVPVTGLILSAVVQAEPIGAVKALSVGGMLAAVLFTGRRVG